MQDDLFSATGTPPKAHRLFFALLPDEAQRRALAACVERLHGHFPGARWVRPQRWHLTLHYLGESAGPREDWIARAIEAGGDLHASGFEQELDRLRALGNPRNPALTLSGEASSPGMDAFWQALRQRLLQAGFRLSARGFVPHLTVAYVPPGPQLPPIAPVALRFDAFHLLQSVEGQAEYDTLGSWRLG
ncbi:hypothetical protein GCM10027084_21120 [Pseudoxanthomonas sangjuensis]|uniref:RNA 2',3'-cyclic phosphodiesterase n=1 Tax=Pseudoxanthomonas sangjuensis TaxID=1503750 RepID=UPI0013907D90|nr:RNA 2',3'-cyclic phosphodiesterase [Pseudoxanthomonas sangjuensis]KAF1715437.1 RNA 2',3'-cyclic phosphodiesterase [Pseudoxanthomonas sangjuensis]